MSEFLSDLENNLQSRKEIQSVLSNIGGEEENLGVNPKANYSPNKAIVRVILKEDRKIKTEEFISNWKKDFDYDPSYQIQFQMSGDIIGSLLSQNKGSMEYLVIGEDLETLAELGQRIKKEINGVNGVLDIKTAMEDKSLEIKLDFDNIKMAKYGLTHASVATFLKTALKGLPVSRMKVQGQEIDIRLKMNPYSTDALEKVKRLKIRTPLGENISISQFVVISHEKNLSSILRRGNFRMNTVSVNLDSQFLKKAGDEIEKKILSIPVPSGFKIQLSGDRENLEKSSKELFWSFALTTLLIYMLLSGQFESFLSSLVMMGTVPLIFIGTFPALILSGKSLNVSSFMGFILLVGIVVDNASLFSEYFHTFVEEGLQLEEAIVESAITVLKPITMNNSTTILGMLPIVLEFGKGSEFQAPLGIVVISGLISATMLSLFIIPTLFYLMNKKSFVQRIE